jgi:hypothetical protein
MMQRGGVSWALHGAVSGQITAYVMSQIAASANQVMKPFHQAVVDALSDIDNDDLTDIRERGIKPYGWAYPKDLPDDILVSAEYEVEIPGDLVQRATTARMLNPTFELSYTYVLGKLFPDIGDPMRQRAQVLADKASLHPSNAMIAMIQYYEQQAAFLTKHGDARGAKLYELMATMALQQLFPQPEQQATARPTAGPGATQQLGPGRGAPMPELGA